MRILGALLLGVAIGCVITKAWLGRDGAVAPAQADAAWRELLATMESADAWWDFTEDEYTVLLDETEQRWGPCPTSLLPTFRRLEVIPRTPKAGNPTYYADALGEMLPK